MNDGHFHRKEREDIMINFGKKIVKHRKLVIIICLLLMIPAVIGYAFTRVNYDLLNYLPTDLETMQGQDIGFS